MRLPAVHDVPVTEHTLPNGLLVVGVDLQHLHTSALIAYVRVGSRFESPKDNGLSHFVEHMLFRGTAAHPSSYELNFAVERLGSTLHAETGRELSLYHLELGVECLEEGFGVLADFVSRPSFQEIDLERRLVLEEIAEDLDDAGEDTHLPDLVRGLAFPKHPLGQKIIGPSANVERFAKADLERHFGRYYAARNMLVCLAGPGGDRLATSLAEKSFAHLPSGDKQHAAPAPPPDDAAIFRAFRFPAAQTSIQVVFRSLAENDADFVALEALVRSIDDGMSTPLHYRLCDQLGLAYSVSAGIEPFCDTGLFEIEGSSSHGKCSQLLSEIFKLCDERRTKNISDAELDKLRRRFRYDVSASMDSATDMASLLGGARLQSGPCTLSERVARLDAVSADDIRRVAERVFRPAGLIVAAMGKLTVTQQRDIERQTATWR